MRKKDNKKIDTLDKTLAIIQQCCKVLDEKKATDLKVLQLPGEAPITDYFLIATATSEPHIRALKNELERHIDKMTAGVKFGYEPKSGWAIVDGIDFVIHIFIEEKRNLYNLESLWKDAKEIKIDHKQ